MLLVEINYHNTILILVLKYNNKQLPYIFQEGSTMLTFSLVQIIWYK